MTAKELIKHLQTLSPDTRICVKGYEGGLDYVSLIRESKILTNKNSEWYYGNHEEQLNIDLHCGHCVCIYCYPRVFEESCPICRL